MGHFFLAKNQKKFPEYRKLFFPEKTPELFLSEVETFFPEIIGNIFSDKKLKKISKKKSETFFPNKISKLFPDKRSETFFRKKSGTFFRIKYSMEMHKSMKLNDKKN
jgi:hypothetical protein